MTMILGGCSTGSAMVPQATIEPPSIPLPTYPVLPAGGDPCEVGSAEEWGCTSAPTAGQIVIDGADYDALTLHLYESARYPGRCQGALDDANSAWLTIVRGLARAEAARLTAERLTGKGIEPWKAYLGAVLGIAGGGLIGFAIGAIVVAVGG